MRALIATLSGSLFGLGLLVSGMVDTTRVQGWLDIFGAWDPTLVFVLRWGDPTDGNCTADRQTPTFAPFGRVIPWPPWSEDNF